MAVHDNIGDFLTVLRNGSRAGREEVETSFSKTREAIGRILVEEGFLVSCESYELPSGVKRLRIRLKYVADTPALTDIQRTSRPGSRRYTKAKESPRVLGGLGFSILSTPRGLLKDREARRQNVGGEIVCSVW